MRKTIGIACALILIGFLFVYFSKTSSPSEAARTAVNMESPVARQSLKSSHFVMRRPTLAASQVPQQRMIAGDVPENPKLARAADILREANLEERVPTGRFVTGKRVQSSKGNFLSSNVRAMPRDQYDQSQGDLVETKAGYAMFVPKAEETSNAGKGVVVNANNGRLGIVTGTIIAQLGNIQDRFALSSAFGLKIVAVDESISAVFFSLTDTNPEQSVEALQKDSRVSSAELEIVEGVKENM